MAEMTCLAGLVIGVGERTDIGNGVAHIGPRNHRHDHHQKNQLALQGIPRAFVRAIFSIELALFVVLEPKSMYSHGNTRRFCGEKQAGNACNAIGGRSEADIR